MAAGPSGFVRTSRSSVLASTSPRGSTWRSRSSRTGSALSSVAGPRRRSRTSCRSSLSVPSVGSCGPPPFDGVPCRQPPHRLPSMRWRVPAWRTSTSGRRTVRSGPPRSGPSVCSGASMPDLQLRRGNLGRHVRPGGSRRVRRSSSGLPRRDENCRSACTDRATCVEWTGSRSTLRTATSARGTVCPDTQPDDVVEGFVRIDGRAWIVVRRSIAQPPRTVVSRRSSTSRSASRASSGTSEKWMVRTAIPSCSPAASLRDGPISSTLRPWQWRTPVGGQTFAVRKH